MPLKKTSLPNFALFVLLSKCSFSTPMIRSVFFSGLGLWCLTNDTFNKLFVKEIVFIIKLNPQINKNTVKHEMMSLVWLD